MEQIAAKSESTPGGMVLLRGTGRGLEIVIDPRAPLYEVMMELEARLAQSPGFFCGSEVVVCLGERPLPPGGLAHLKAISDRYELKIVELRTTRSDIQQAASNLSIPTVEIQTTPEPPPTAAVAEAAAKPPVASAAASAAPPVLMAVASERESARLLQGPIRSGTVLTSASHVVIIGDVNPGAEVRAGGNIVVMGSLRGLAHAACGGDSGYIVALRLGAQQLRIGGLIARAEESQGQAQSAEIAYALSGRIVVEPYAGKLPGGFHAAKR
jgi:septum site-determining protein MinC